MVLTAAFQWFLKRDYSHGIFFYLKNHSSFQSELVFMLLSHLDIAGERHCKWETFEEKHFLGQGFLSAALHSTKRSA